jgi:hypothetical protein
VNRLIRILPIAASLLGVTMIFGCANELSAPSEPAFAQFSPSVLTPCREQPYATAAAWIGPKGGMLRAGKHVLKVPTGALSTTVWIRMEAPSSTINRVVFEPEGLTFKYPANLTMSYSNCVVAPGTEQQIVYLNDQFRIVEITPSETDPETETVTGQVRHFSDYALSTYAVVY